MKCRLFIIAFLTFLFCSCKVEFSPNADWKDIPVVYCVLDPDDDTSWVRVQRCYLKEGEIYSAASITDSVSYPADSIEVVLYVRHNDQSVDSMTFLATFMDRQEGSFASENQVAYYYPTAGRLNNAEMYELYVRKKSTGALLASASTLPVIPPDNIIRKPANNDKFGFYSANNSCLIEWNTFTNARMYEPVVRFYYSEHGDTLSVDIHCGRIYQTKESALTLSTNYLRTSFLSDLKLYLQPDTAAKIYVPMVDLYINACNEDLNAYLSSVSANSGSLLSTQIYSNISGGLGIFATRRTHLFKHLSSDVNKVPNSGLYWFLTQLGVNIVGISGIE